MNDAILPMRSPEADGTLEAETSTKKEVPSLFSTINFSVRLNLAPTIEKTDEFSSFG
jgi:hypothetical protein